MWNRFVLLSLSFGFNTTSLFKITINEYLCRINKRTGKPIEEYPSSETSTIKSNGMSFNFTGISVPESVYLSREGILFLATSYRFANCQLGDIPDFASFDEIIKVYNEIVLENKSNIGLGLPDCLCFWAL